MPVTAENLRAYVGASSIDDAYLGSCVATATSLVAAYISGGYGGYGIGGYGTEGYGDPVAVPEAIIDRATLEVGSELFHRRQAPNGIAQFASPDGGQAVRVARDPMVAARPILAPFLPLGFA